MIIPQAGVSKELLPTVTAVISATPNLGGVLGVGIVGTSELYISSASEYGAHRFSLCTLPVSLDLAHC